MPIFAPKFDQWRSDEPPVIEAEPLHIQIDEASCPDEAIRHAVKKAVIENYSKSMRAMEFAVSRTALNYAADRQGPLFRFAYDYSQRYYDMYKAIAQMEAEQKLPIIPATPGQIKQQGFSTEEILGLIQPAKQLMPICDQAFTYFQKNSEQYRNFLAIMTDSRQRNNPRIVADLAPELRALIEAYKSITISDKEYQTLEGQIFTKFTEPELALRFIRVMKDPDLRAKLLRGGNPDSLPDTLRPFIEARTQTIRPDLKRIIVQYDKVALLDRVYFMHHDFGHLPYDEITQLLYSVALIPDDADFAKTLSTPQERLLMEIRHRVAGDMSKVQNALGTLGGNPMAYVNMLEKGEADAFAEFRERMYFVYMNNHFANYIILNPEVMDYVNQYLRVNNRGWQIDSEFVEVALNRANTRRIRDGKDIAPIFRYGAHADLNWALRTLKSNEEVSKFYWDNPNIALNAAMEMTAGLDAYFHFTLSDRELMNQIGEINAERAKQYGDQLLNFGTGAAVFDLIMDIQKLHDEAPRGVRDYLQHVLDLYIPVVSGISGTLDQSTAMAGLVGLGVHEDTTQRARELQAIKLAYLAFMLPGRDHSVHEILQSSKTFGLPYVAGPGYQRYIYPDDPAFLAYLEMELHKRGVEFPDYYLSPEAIQREIENQIQLAASHEREAPCVASPRSITRNYFLGIPLHGEMLRQLDDRAGLVDAIRENFPASVAGLKPIPDKNLHITIGWFEYREPLSQELQDQITKTIANIIHRYRKFTFQLKGFSGHKTVLQADLVEQTGQLDDLRNEIVAALQRMAPTVEFKFKAPHVSVANADSELPEVLPQPEASECGRYYRLSNIDMMYWNMQQYRFVSSRRYALQTYSPQIFHQVIEEKVGSGVPEQLGLGASGANLLPISLKVKPGE